MSTTSKLEYLNNTKEMLKDRLNSLGSEITSSTTFRDYLTWLDTFYEEVSDKTDLSENGIAGRINQETTTGKNLWGGYLRDVTTAGIYFSYNKNGSVFINGTATANAYSIGVQYAITNRLYNVLEAGTYTVSKDSSDYDVTLYDTNNNNILNLNGSTLTGTFTLNSEIGIIMRLRVNNGTTITNKTAYIQIESGSIATNWEKYTGGQPSPSISYPQSIITLTGNVFYKITTQNDEKTFIVPLSNIELGEINTYKDKIYLNTGKFYLKKEIAKISSYSGETITTDYKSTTGGLNTGATIYYGINTTTTEITSSNYPELYAVLKEIQDYLTSYKINKEFVLDYSSPEIEY